jgi:hypothetical protein
MSGNWFVACTSCQLKSLARGYISALSDGATKTKGGPFPDQDPSTEMTACEMIKRATDIQIDESLFCKSKVSIPTLSTVCPAIRAFSLGLRIMSDRTIIKKIWTLPPRRNRLVLRAHAPRTGPASRRAPLRLTPDPSRATHLAHASCWVPSPLRQWAFIGRQRRWAHVATLCFMHFQMYVTYVSSKYCKNKSGVVYIAMAIHVCCKYMFQRFQLFQTYVASVSFRCCIYCSGYTHMLQLCFSNVSAVSSGSCMFSSGCCICCSVYTCMLQVYAPNV